MNILLSLSTLILFIIISINPANSQHNCNNLTFDDQKIISHIRYLASDELEGRMSGTKGAQEAAEYIVSEFQNAGLKPIGDNGSYYQNFFFTKGISLGTDNSFEIEIEGNNNKLILGNDYNSLSFSTSGEVSEYMVFAGYGISAPELNYDDYEGIDVKGKVVMVLRYTPEGYDINSPFYNYAPLRYKALNAREKGASAIIFVTPYSQEEEPDITKVGLDFSYSDSGIKSLILRRDKAQRVLKAQGKDLKKLEQQLSEKENASFLIPSTIADIKTQIIEERGESSNVIGMIEGSDPELKSEYIFIGAHYDHIGFGKRNSRATNTAKREVHNGADDNASGVAGLIELSKYFSCNKESLKRSLVFIAFSAEELGLIGASNYIDNPKLPLDKTIAMINMDMIGRLEDNKLTVLGVGSSPKWNDLINSANQQFGFELSLDKSGFAPSDQSVFFAKGIPVLHFFTGLHDDYHTPEDDWDKINSKGQQKVLKLMESLISKLATQDIELTFSNEDEPKKGFAKFNIYLGTIPDYSNQTKGVKLMGVKEGSPADSAGLKSEDTIIEYNGVEIRSIYDYVYAVGGSKAGIPTNLVVLRNYKPVSLIIVPEQRQDTNDN
ncbi:MAG: M20/M25/M40 family metallo-hydrolase [Thermodesulfobacteriota bacterium]